MAGIDASRAELEALGVKIVAASVDAIDRAREVADEVYFPVGYGVTRAMADTLDAWWEERRQIIQPSQFVLSPEGKVIASCYSDGPLGRIVGDDIVRFVRFQKSRA